MPLRHAPHLVTLLISLLSQKTHHQFHNILGTVAFSFFFLSLFIFSYSELLNEYVNKLCKIT